jgi:hypothetical protein
MINSQTNSESYKKDSDQFLSSAKNSMEINIS